MLKKTLSLFLLWMLSVSSFLPIFFTNSSDVYAKAPSFTEDMWDKLINADWDGVDEDGRMYRWELDKDKTLKENILSLFYPDASGNWWQIWEFLRIIMYAVIAWALIYVGILFVKDAGEWDSKAKEHIKTMMFILLGWSIVLLSTWILWSALDIGKWSAELVSNLENNLLFQILAFLKWMAFFVAVIFLIRNGYTMMRTTEWDEKLTKWKNWVLAVVVSLIFIKSIDYIYYIAQASDLKQQATDLIIEVSKMLGYIVWAFAVFMILYAWFRLITDGGKWEWFAVFKKVIVWTFVSAIVIFLFLLIMYQVVQEFA